METVLGIHEMHLTHNKGVHRYVTPHPPTAVLLAMVALVILVVKLSPLVAKVSCSLCSGREAVIDSRGLMDVQRKNVQTLVLVVADKLMKVDHYGKSF